MNFCSSCGNKITDNAKFCSRCGISLAGRGESFPQKDDKIARLSVVEQSEIAKTIFVVNSRVRSQFSSLLDRLGASPLDIISNSDIKILVEMAIKRIEIANRNGKLGYVCLIGDWNDVPPFRIESPISGDDGDEHCISDAPYGIIGGNESLNHSEILSHIPHVPVGRIPSSDMSVIEKVFRGRGSDTYPIDAFQLAVTAECWKEATVAIAEKFTQKSGQINLYKRPIGLEHCKHQILSSPDWNTNLLAHGVRSRPLGNGSLVLFNVHGSAEVTSWFGEGQSEMPEIFRPGTIESFDNAVVVSEACYGGALGYDEPSVVEHFFSNGGRAFVGCSVIAYGTPDDSLCGADLIALNFLKAIQSGANFGESLSHAKLEVGVSAPDCYDVSLKTVMSFNLYGAPWQKFTADERSPAKAQAEIQPDFMNLRDRVQSRMGALREKVASSFSSRRDDYRSRLPDRLRRTILEREQVLKLLSKFRDYKKISEKLDQLNSEIGKCTFEKIDSRDFTGYQISGKSSLKFGGVQSFTLITESNGILRKIILSKGVEYELQ